MKSVLEDLFYGDINPMEQFYPKGEEYKRIYKVYDSYCESFRETIKALDPSLDKAFIDLTNKYLEVIDIEVSEVFIRAFRLGARMMLEVLEKD